jgi:hypothetical protein
MSEVLPVSFCGGAMSTNSVYYFFMLLGTTPALPIVVIGFIVLHYNLRRAVWKRRKGRGGRSSGFCPSSSSLGMALQFMQVYHRPSMCHVLVSKRDEDADEEEDGDPESIQKQLSRQLKRIRRGEAVDRLVLRI